MTTTKVNSEFIAVNAISGTIIADGAITSTHLAANCVDSSELVTGSIDTIHIAANQVTSTKIVTNGVLTRHISDDQITADKLANSINTDIATGPAALPKAGGTMTGTLNITQASTADTIKLTRSTTAQNNMIKFASDSADKWIVGQRNDSTEHFRFYSYGTSSDVLSILTDGNVGIGTTSPDRKLDVSGTGNVYGKFQSTNATGAGIEVKDTGEDWLIQADDGTGSGGLAFYDLGRTAYRMFLDASGNLGIGTTSPSQKLDVNGTVELNNLTVGGAQGSDGQLLTSTGSGIAWEDAPAGGPTFKTFGTASLMIGSNSTGTINAADYNTAVSTTAFAALTTGDFNVAFGEQALDALTTGGGNTALGVSTLGALTTANNNTAVGISALTSNTDGTLNNAVGSDCMALNTTGSYNVAVGSLALYSNTTASNNTAVGYRALDACTEGGANTAVGKDALGDLTTGSENVGVGWTAGGDITTARFCTAVGRQALRMNTTTEYLTAVGYSAARSCTGETMAAFGTHAAYSNTSGVSNTAIGAYSLYSCTTANRNTALGHRAGFGYTGSENIFIGNEAGEGSSSGNFNTFVGHQAGESTNGSSNIILGNATSIGSVSNRYVIGNSNNGTGTQDYAVAFVRSSDWSRILIGGTSISASSDERMKKDIANHTLGLSFINRLRPVNFKWKAPSEFPESFTSFDSETTTATRTDWQTGLIAQEVKAAMDAEGIETEKFDGWNEEEDGSQALSPAQLIMPLIKAIQEQQTIIDDLKARIETLEG